MINLDKPSRMSSPASNKIPTSFTSLKVIPLKLIFCFVGLALIGFLDAVYLTTAHYTGTINCSVISGCQEVLVSQYSIILSIPVALLGTVYYIFILLNALLYIDRQTKLSLKVLKYLPSLGWLFSLYLIYLMFFVIKALCQYCLLSAITSTLLFIMSLILLNKSKKI